jgi:hypothetical protein
VRDHLRTHHDYGTRAGELFDLLGPDAGQDRRR